MLVRDGRTAARIVDLDGSERSRVLPMPAVVIDGAFSPNGTHVAIDERRRDLAVARRDNDLQDALEGHAGTVKSVAFRSNGELVSAGEDGALITWAMGDWSGPFRDWKREGNGS